MKIFNSPLFLVLISTIYCSIFGGVAFANPFLPDGNGLISMEAEHFSAQTSGSGHSWQIESSPLNGFSGEGAMRATPDAGLSITSNFANTSPRMDFPVQINTPGNYYVWIRGRGINGAANSVHVGLDGAEVTTADQLGFPSGGGAYTWSNGNHFLTISNPGLHTINVWMREDGSIVDKLEITLVSNYTPTGIGATESPRDGTPPNMLLPFSDDFNDGQADGWTVINDSPDPSDWQVNLEKYRQLNDVTLPSNPNGALTESFNRGTYAYLASGFNLDDFQFKVEIDARSSSGEDIGVMFRYQNDDNYYRLSINSNRGFSRFEKKVAGVFTTIAKNSRGYTQNQMLNLRIDAMGPLLQIYINGDPVFSAYDDSLPSGTVGLYSRDVADFDNVVLLENDSAPSIVIESPIAHTVLPDGPLNIQVSAIALNVPQNNGSVDIELDGSSCGVTNEVAGEPGKYSATCNTVPPSTEDYIITAKLLDGLNVVATDTNQAIGIGGSNLDSDHYIAIGDSITNGTDDNYSADNSTTDNRVISFQGWPATLSELLNNSSAYRNLVTNEGIGGDRTQNTRTRADSILDRNKDANRALILLGTNDSGIDIPTNTVRNNLRAVINKAEAKGISNIKIALIPPVDGDAPRNNVIAGYNTMIANEIVAIEPNVDLGPDFFTCFQNRFSLFQDTLHPNGLGYVMVAYLWKDVLDGNPVTPGGPCPAPIYILENINLNGYKQNILEVGDEYYQDSNFVLNNIPNELADGVWIMTQNSDSTNTSDNFLTFDVGSSPVTVYVAYASGTTPPTWLTNNFTNVNLSSDLTASGGNVSTFDIYRRNNDATGTVTLGGNKASGSVGGAIDNYIVIVIN